MNWPKYDENLLENDKINVVIQINGKKRKVLNVNKGIEETKLLETVKKDKMTSKYLINISIKKIIYIQDRLMNILIND